MVTQLRSALAGVLTVLASAAGAAGASEPPPLLGVKYGNQGWDLASVRALEVWQGRSHDVLVLFTAWDRRFEVQDNLFRRQLPAVWAHGAVPLVTWELFTDGRTPSDIVSQVSAGEHDAYVKQWATRLRRFLSGADGRFGTGDDRRVYLRLGHEMNGDWYPWGQPAPGQFIAMWRRVHRIFDNLGLGPTHVQWMWCVTNVDQGPFAAEEFYPGDDWVDWVAIDGYNWGASTRTSRWQSPAEVLSPMVARLQALTTRPLALAEVATTSLTTDGNDPAAKNRWISELYAWVPTAPVRMVCWYNLDRDAEFAVFGGAAGDEVVRIGGRDALAFSGYRAAIATLEPAAAPGHPRLLSDDRFAGR